MAKYTILVVDDEAPQRDALFGFLKKKGYEALVAATGKAALQHVQEQTIDLVLTDLRMPEMDGAELLNEIKKLNPDIAVIVMTAFGSIETAIDAMKNGASDFMIKPINLDRLEITIAKALEHKQLISENERLRALVNERLQFGSMITSSPAMQQALSVAARVAPSKASVLIIGESGVGKELIARAIHQAGSRSKAPFVAVNMAALSDNLVESELFGHEKGAFTGANQQRKGRFELADGGTLFIDEVGDIPLHIQVKLLRVLQEQTIDRIGSADPIRVDVRIIAATNRPLEEMVKNGQFREDFYYRLNVVKILLPPLRERKSDLPILLDIFRKRYSEMNGKEVVAVSREAMDHLMKYSYPGNVRELENIIERAVVLCRDDIITAADLPSVIREESFWGEFDEEHGAFDKRIASFEIKLIRKALEESSGVQTRAAELLGMSERHLRYKLQKYGMKG